MIAVLFTYNTCTCVGQYFIGIIHPPESFIFPPDPQPFLLPLLIIWHPVVTYKHIFVGEELLCPHETCKKMTVLKGWHGPHYQPRTIHDVNDIILLVSAIYICEDGHKTFANDARILKIIATCRLSVLGATWRHGDSSWWLRPQLWRNCE